MTDFLQKQFQNFLILFLVMLFLVFGSVLSVIIAKKDLMAIKRLARVVFNISITYYLMKKIH